MEMDDDNWDLPIGFTCDTCFLTMYNLQEICLHHMRYHNIDHEQDIDIEEIFHYFRRELNKWNPRKEEEIEVFKTRTRS